MLICHGCSLLQQVNENFYRTTFYELCSRYLSSWLAFTVESSYPQGKSDLEFIGKFHEKFAGRRWVIEFKYYSNAELTKMKTTVDKFTIQEADTEQIRSDQGICNRADGPVRRSQNQLACYLLLRQPGI
jgi:hypothetical protein